MLAGGPPNLYNRPAQKCGGLLAKVGTFGSSSGQSFGAMVRVNEADTASGKQRVWMLSRNCALTPRQVGTFYLSLVVTSVVIATVFVIQGVWMVLPFSLIEMLAVGAALLVYARHAVDCERVSLGSDALTIEAIDGNTRSVIRVDPHAARVVVESTGRGAQDVVFVVVRNERIAVGRFVCERERRRFARELRLALRSRYALVGT